MEHFRKTFFQLLLIILALAFTACIRYISDTKNIQSGTFAANESSNLTVSDIFERCISPEDGK